MNKQLKPCPQKGGKDRGWDARIENELLTVK
jgi:hypothetical protein